MTVHQDTRVPECPRCKGSVVRHDRRTRCADPDDTGWSCGACGHFFAARCEHDWRYFEDPDHEYTGFLERCAACGEIVQVPQ